MEENNKKFSIKLNKVKIEEINFREPDDKFVTAFDEKLLQIHIGTAFSYNIDKDILSAHINILYDYEDSNVELKNNLLNFKGNFEFLIGNFKNVINISGDKIDVPDMILEITAGIAISSARGIIIAKTAGSFINNFYVPIVSPQEIVAKLKEQLSLQSNVVPDKKIKKASK